MKMQSLLYGCTRMKMRKVMRLFEESSIFASHHIATLACKSKTKKKEPD